MQLHEINKQVKALLAETEENEGELTDAQLADLAVLEIEFDEKVQNVVLFARQQDAEAKVIKEEVDRLTRLMRRRTSNVAKLKQYLLDAMQTAGLQRAGGTLAGARVQKNPPSVNLVDASQVPETFVFMVPQIETAKILERLKAGESVPGAELKQGAHVRFI